jgi:dihydrodipicolinate synthase/N-acetylneuraminate lyase
VRDYRVRLKEALTELGVIARADCRPPLLPLGETERVAVRQAARAAALKMPAAA